jgi:hypothetical protein
MSKAISQSFYVYEKASHEKLAPVHIRNGGRSVVPIQFKRPAAMEISKVLNVSMAVNGEFEGALEMRGEHIVLSEHMKKYMEDDAVVIDFEYFGIKELNTRCTCGSTLRAMKQKKQIAKEKELNAFHEEEYDDQAEYELYEHDPEVWTDYMSEELVTAYHILLEYVHSQGLPLLDNCQFSDFAEFCYKFSSGRKPAC